MCNRLHLLKNCSCCFLDIHLFSDNLSPIAAISSSFILEIFPACFSCSNIFLLSHISLGWDGKKLIFEIPETVIAGELSNFIEDLPLLIGRRFGLISDFLLFQTRIKVSDPVG